MRLFPRRHDEPVPAGPSRADIERAYERGREDERARHHSHPILGLIIAAAAIIGNNTGSGNAATGALIGGAAGAAIGAAKGCSDVGGCGERRRYYDQRAGRYYYYDSRSGRYFWDNGDPRY